MVKTGKNQMMIFTKKNSCLAISLVLLSPNSYAYICTSPTLSASISTVTSAVTTGFATLEATITSQLLSQTQTLLNGLAGIDASVSKNATAVTKAVDAHAKVMDGIEKRRKTYEIAREQTRLYEQVQESQCADAVRSNRMESGDRDRAMASTTYATGVTTYRQSYSKASGAQTRRASQDIPALETANGVKIDDGKNLFPIGGTMTRQQAVMAAELVNTLIDPSPMPEISAGSTSNPVAENQYIALRKELDQKLAVPKEVMTAHLSRKTATYDLEQWASTLWGQTGQGTAGNGGTPDGKVSFDTVLETFVKSKSDNLEWHKFVAASDDITIEREQAQIMAFGLRMQLDQMHMQEQQNMMLAQMLSQDVNETMTPKLKSLYVNSSPTN